MHRYRLVMLKFSLLSKLDGCILLKRAGSTESLCYGSVPTTKIGRKQRVLGPSGEYCLLFSTTALSFSLSNSFHYSFQFQSYQPAEDLGRAFSDRSILQTFINVEATLPVGSLKLRVTVTDFNVLATLRTLYALSCLEEVVAFL
ncbi:putative acyl-CoA oxidase [Rosa chinensis]|uniref:Putative acyl-CoA oxidase n=1 Tax=Rosa chinensis TaxID=74649 RepID=A0A2P6PEA7_ROSCH|nr:putative acyl-CoA oxidase [Rosa chinensis]